MQTQKAKKEE